MGFLCCYVVGLHTDLRDYDTENFEMTHLEAFSGNSLERMCILDMYMKGNGQRQNPHG